jgi:hypothetical protein
METDPDQQELLRLYWNMNTASQQALLQCARLLVADPQVRVRNGEFSLQAHLIEHFAMLSDF